MTLLRRATLALAIFLISNVLGAEFVLHESSLVDCSDESGGCKWDSTQLWHENKFPEPDDSVVFDLTKNGESSSKYYVSIESEVVISSLKILTAISRAPTSASELRIEITKPLVVKTLEVSGFYTSVVLNSTLKAQTLSISDGGTLLGGTLSRVSSDKVSVTTHGTLAAHDIRCSEINAIGASVRSANGAVDKLILSEGAVLFETGSMDIKTILSASGKIESHSDSVLNRLETLQANKTALQLRGRTLVASSESQIRFFESSGTFVVPSGSSAIIYAYGSQLILSAPPQADGPSDASLIARHYTQFALGSAMKANVTLSDFSTLSVLTGFDATETGVTFADATGTFRVLGTPLFQRGIALNQTKLVYVSSSKPPSSEPHLVLNASFYTGKFANVVELEEDGVTSSPQAELQYKDKSIELLLFTSPAASAPSTRAVVALVGFIFVFLLIFGGIVATFFSKYHRKCRDRTAVVDYSPVGGQEDRYS